MKMRFYLNTKYFTNYLFFLKCLSNNIVVNFIPASYFSYFSFLHFCFLLLYLSSFDFILLANK